MAYTGIRELPTGMIIEQEEIDLFLNRILISFIHELDGRGLKCSKDQIVLEKTPQGLKFTIHVEGVEFIYSAIFDRCFAQAVLVNLT